MIIIIIYKKSFFSLDIILCSFKNICILIYIIIIIIIIK